MSARPSKQITADEALAKIPDGCAIATCGFTMMGACETILKRIERSFLATGSPRDLRLYHGAGQSDRENGIEHLAHEGLLARVVGAHWGLAPKIGALIHENQVEAHCLPQGQCAHLSRAMASGKPGNFSVVGLGTFIDPRLEGGMMNDRARAAGTQVEVIEILGTEYLFYRAQPIEVALIRGTRVGTDGNLSTEDEAVKLETICVAQAAKAAGGIVIAQAREVVPAGTIPARLVDVPGICVDFVVEAEDPQTEHRQTASAFFDAAYVGAAAESGDTADLPPLPLDARKVIGRRGADELFEGAVVNLGTGIPGDTIGPIAAERGVLSSIHLTVESGVIGGVPSGGTDFGIARGADAIIGHDHQFDYYNGTGVDVTYMGAAEVDAEGNVNVSKFGTRAVGCGGFIDITQPAKKVVFLLTFTAGGFRARVGGGELAIEQEGRFPKFVKEVGQVTFSGDYARRTGQPVLFVTERAVFRLADEGIELIEVARGIDVEADVLAHMAFRPSVAEPLATMAASLFS